MGGGTSKTKDVPRRGSGESLLKAVGELSSGIEASGGAVASSEEFCAREHRLRFRVTNGRTPQTGEEISLVAGEPLQLADSRGVLGVIESDAAAPLNNCLGLNWTMSGTIAIFDVVAGRGVAVVTGAH